MTVYSGDFLTQADANICYEKGTLTLGLGSNKVYKVLTSVTARGQAKRVRRLELPGRTEIVVSLPVENDEGLTGKRYYKMECIWRERLLRYGQVLQ